MIQCRSSHLEGAIKSPVKSVHDRSIHIPCQLPLVSLTVLVRLESKENVEGVNARPTKKRLVGKATTDERSVRGEGFEEADGTHLAEVADHSGHGHVVEESSPHLKERERE